MRQKISGLLLEVFEIHFFLWEDGIFLCGGFEFPRKWFSYGVLCRWFSHGTMTTFFVTSQTTGKGNLNIFQATHFLVAKLRTLFFRNKLLCLLVRIWSILPCINSIDCKWNQNGKIAILMSLDEPNFSAANHQKTSLQLFAFTTIYYSAFNNTKWPCNPFESWLLVIAPSCLGPPSSRWHHCSPPQVSLSWSPSFLPPWPLPSPPTWPLTRPLLPCPRSLRAWSQTPAGPWRKIITS